MPDRVRERSRSRERESTRPRPSSPGWLRGTPGIGPSREGGPNGPPQEQGARDRSGPPRNGSDPPRNDSGPPRDFSGQPRGQGVRDVSGPPRDASGLPHERDASGPPRGGNGLPDEQGGRCMGGPPRDASRGGSAEARTGPPQDKLGPPEDRTGPPRDHGEIERLCHAATPPVGRMMSLRNSGDGMSVCEILEDWGIIDANKVKEVAAHEREQRCDTRRALVECGVANVLVGRAMDRHKETSEFLHTQRRNSSPRRDSDRDAVAGGHARDQGRHEEDHARDLARQLEASEERARAALAAKEEEVARLSHAAAQHEIELSVKDAALAAKEDQRLRGRQEHDTELAAKDAELLRARQEKTRQLEKRDEHAARLRREQAQEHEIELSVKDTALAAKDGEIASLRHAGEQHETALAATAAALAAKEDELLRARQEQERELCFRGRGLEALGKRRRVAADAACMMDGRLVKVEKEKHDAEEDLEESRDNMNLQIRATDALMSKVSQALNNLRDEIRARVGLVGTEVDDLAALALAGGADAVAVNAIKYRALA